MTANRLSWKSLFISLTVVAVSTILLYLLIWDYGARYTVADPRVYLVTGLNFFRGHGLVTTGYDIEADAVTSKALVHYPPVVPIIYGLLMFLGLVPDKVPTVVSLIAWPLFLSGLGLLTYRLSRSPVISTFSVIFAAITWPYLLIFAATRSEVIFLLLLVFFLVFVPNPVQQQKRLFFPQLIIAAMLLGLLMLTRYVGLFFFVAVVSWWSLWRFKQRQVARLLTELFVFGLVALPFLSWLIRNEFLSGSLFGSTHLSADPTERPFIYGLIKVVQHSSWIVLPAVRPDSVWRSFGWLGVLVCLISVAIGFYLLLLGYRSERSHLWALPTHPLPVVLATYIAVYTLVQPFLAFDPMDIRDATTMLCLVQPWLLSMMARAPLGWASSFLTGHAAINLVLLSLLSFSRGISDWIALDPPQFHDLANRHKEVELYVNRGMPSWLLHGPPRLRDLANHHEDVLNHLQSFGLEVAIVSNAPDLFLYPNVATGWTPMSDWLSRGTCTPQHDVVIIVFDWDRWSEGLSGDTTSWEQVEKFPAQLQDEVEQKCPGIAKTMLKHSVVYHLPKQKLITTRGQ